MGNSGQPPLPLTPFEFKVSLDKPTVEFLTASVSNPSVIPDKIPTSILALYKLATCIRTPSTYHTTPPSRITFRVIYKGIARDISVSFSETEKITYLCMTGISWWMLLCTLSQYKAAFAVLEAFDAVIGKDVEVKASAAHRVAIASYRVYNTMSRTNRLNVQVVCPIEITHFAARHAFLAHSIASVCANLQTSAVDTTARMVMAATPLFSEQTRAHAIHIQPIQTDADSDLIADVACFAAESAIIESGSVTMNAFCADKHFSKERVVDAVRVVSARLSTHAMHDVSHNLFEMESFNIVGQLVEYLLCLLPSETSPESILFPSADVSGEWSLTDAELSQFLVK